MLVHFVDFLRKLTRLDFHLRLVRYQDLPPKRFLCRRDLRQHFEEGLAIILWYQSHTRDGQVSVDLSESRICFG